MKFLKLLICFETGKNKTAKITANASCPRDPDCNEMRAPNPNATSLAKLRSHCVGPIRSKDATMISVPPSSPIASGLLRLTPES